MINGHCSIAELTLHKPSGGSLLRSGDGLDWNFRDGVSHRRKSRILVVVTADRCLDSLFQVTHFSGFIVEHIFVHIIFTFLLIFRFLKCLFPLKKA